MKEMYHIPIREVQVKRCAIFAMGRKRRHWCQLKFKRLTYSLFAPPAHPPNASSLGKFWF